MAADALQASQRAQRALGRARSDLRAIALLSHEVALSNAVQQSAGAEVLAALRAYLESEAVYERNSAASRVEKAGAGAVSPRNASQHAPGVLAPAHRASVVEMMREAATQLQRAFRGLLRALDASGWSLPADAAVGPHEPHYEAVRTMDGFMRLAAERLGTAPREASLVAARESARKLAEEKDALQRKYQALLLNLATQKELQRSSLARAREQIARLDAELAAARAAFEAEAGALETRVAADTKAQQQSHEEKMRALRVANQEAEAKLAAEAAANDAELDAQRKRIKQMEKAIESKIAAYDAEMPDLTQRADTLEQLHAAEAARLEVAVGNAARLIEARLAYEESMLKPRRLAREAAERREKAACVIQRAFRRHFAARRGKKKGKKPAAGDGPKTRSARPRADKGKAPSSSPPPPPQQQQQPPSSSDAQSRESKSASERKSDSAASGRASKASEAQGRVETPGRASKSDSQSRASRARGES